MTHSEAGKLGAIKRRENLVKRFNIDPNVCRYCSHPLLLREGEQPSWAKKRRFCNNSCSAKFNNRLRESRMPLCANGCGRRVKTGAGRFCSNRCQMARDQELYIAQWKSGKVSGGTLDGYTVHPTVRRYMLAKAGSKCEQCGWNQVNSVTKKTPLQIDHIDGDASNNAETNLKVLCPNCHSLTSTFGVLNKGRGRPARRAKDKKYHIALTVAA